MAKYFCKVCRAIYPFPLIVYVSIANHSCGWLCHKCGFSVPYDDIIDISVDRKQTLPIFRVILPVTHYELSEDIISRIVYELKVSFGYLPLDNNTVQRLMLNWQHYYTD